MIYLNANYLFYTDALLSFGEEVGLPYSEPFTFQFLTYHEEVYFEGSCGGKLYRIGD